ncbi:MAG: hypothetical protein ACKOX3_09320 [Bacteroidota bacterium]
MKKTILQITACTTILLASCNTPNNESESCSSNDINPNGSSELSLIMRKMATHLEKNRDALKAGKSMIPAPHEIDQLISAQKTDPSLDTTIFNAYARIYQQRIKEMAAAPDSLKIMSHNNLVSTCRDCHGNFCPGPMKVINQLDIK